MLRGRNKAFFVCLVVGFTVTGIWWLIYLKHFSLLEYFEHKVYDRQLQAYTAEVHPEKVLIVDIDEASLLEYGQLPWSRYILAQLQQKIINSGAKVIAYNYLISGVDHSSPQQIKEKVAKEFKINFSWVNLPKELENYDQLFFQTLTNFPTVLGCLLPYKAGIGTDLREVPVGYPLAISEEYWEPRLLGTPGVLWGGHHPVSFREMPKKLRNRSAEKTNFKRIIAPLGKFSEVSALGFLNANSDDDGKIRKIKMIQKNQNRFLVHLALRALLMEKNITELVLYQDERGDFFLENRQSKFRLPLSYDKTISIRFHPESDDYTRISACKVLGDDFDPTLFKDRIIFIGSSNQQFKNLVSTPLNKNIPIVELNAAVVDNLLNHHYLIEPVISRKLQSCGIIISGILMTILGGLFSLIPIFLTVGLSVVIAIISDYLFNLGLLFTPVYIVGVVLSVTVILLITKFFFEAKQRTVLREAFSHYLSPEMVQQIEEEGREIFKGQEKEVTLMFADICDFTSISEKLSPEQVVNLLNRYFTPMTACVKKHGGTLDKLIGDALMAFWNAPLPIINHAQKAAETALEMQSILKNLNRELIKDFKVSLKMNIGLHTGVVYVGNMGSKDLLDYTCIGDSVNLASRVENLCRYYEFPLLITQHSAERCNFKNFKFRTVDTIRVTGKNQPIIIKAVLSEEELSARQEEFNYLDQAIALYKKGDFVAAIDLFKSIKDQFIQAKKSCDLYIQRCQKLKSINHGWDGIWTFKNK